MGTGGQNRYMQQMTPNPHQQQMMGVAPHMNMQGMQPNAHLSGMRAYPSYLPQYMPNQQSKFHRYEVYPPMNYYYQMQNYQQGMMMAGQQHNSKQQYMSQKMPGQYIMQPHQIPQQLQPQQQQHVNLR